jgi:F-type H+-transporting ATPase subunit epsilon
MSTATWRQFFTYRIFFKCPSLMVLIANRYNKYTQIAARAVRQSLKENERVAAEKRGLTALRYQHWEGGKGGEQVAFSPSPYSLTSWLTRETGIVGVSPPAS